MNRLANHELGRVLPRYLAGPAFFPLIAAVLDRSQDGAVFVDDPTNIGQAYVEHAFGFAQIFGQSTGGLAANLAVYLSERRGFQVEKVRLYTPQIPDFLLAPAFLRYRSERQQFILAPPRPDDAARQNCLGPSA